MDDRLEGELLWWFNACDGELGARAQTYDSVGGGTSDPEARLLSERTAAACAKYRRVGAAMARLSTEDVMVLRARFIGLPQGLRELLGKALVASVGGVPLVMHAPADVARTIGAGGGALERMRDAAKHRVDVAMRAYAAAREAGRRGAAA